MCQQQSSSTYCEKVRCALLPCTPLCFAAPGASFAVDAATVTAPYPCRPSCPNYHSGTRMRPELEQTGHAHCCAPRLIIAVLLFYFVAAGLNITFGDGSDSSFLGRLGLHKPVGVSLPLFAAWCAMLHEFQAANGAQQVV